jgi:predicted nucleotidyltransferase
MNIHFTDKKLFEQLQKATLAKVIVGSHLYGTNNEKSDIDYLYIYATSQNEMFSAIKTHHQLQYKENNIDYNFVSLHSFICNILNGDSTINFEVVQSDLLKDSVLDFLYEIRNEFITYTVIKSYLGLARRDVKHYHKADTEYLKKKRLGHIIRGYLYARDMLYNKFNFELINKELISILNTIDVSNNKLLKEYDKEISNLRNELNDKLNNKTLNLAQHLSVDASKKITEELIYLCDSDIFKQKQNHLNNFDMSYYLEAYENWVSY